jgi:hypothetical protein
MALGSPGVQVQVIDESFYLAAAPGTVPLIFVATAQNKSNASKTGTAQGTLAANAGKVYVITSQRDLTDTFGTPLFYTDNNSNPIHGGELNEYGLQAAYSLLGATSRAYIVRADINLGQLQPTSSAPAGNPVSGTYWLDTRSSLFGISEWDSTTKKFTAVTPLIIDDTNKVTSTMSGVPVDAFGKQGDYAVVVTNENTNAIYYKTTLSTAAWVLVSSATLGDGLLVTVSPYNMYPTYTVDTPTGSVWIKTSTQGFGANWVVKYYNGAAKSWATISAPIYQSTQKAIQVMDATGGSKIPVGTLFVEAASNGLPSENAVANFKIWRRSSTGATTIVSAVSNTMSSTDSTFAISETLTTRLAQGPSGPFYPSLPLGLISQVITVTVPGSTTESIASLIPAALNTAGLVNVSATYDSVSKQVSFSHALGGDFSLVDVTGIALATIGLDPASTANLYAAQPDSQFAFLASNWKPLRYEAIATAPVTIAEDGQLWYNSVLDADIMVHDGQKWVGYLSPTSPYYNDNTSLKTDPQGPIISALEPTAQSDSTPLVDGDIWLSTSSVEAYGRSVYVYDGNLLKWILQDVSDQTSPDGWLFADARWGTEGYQIQPASITSLLVSDYVDPDTPDPELYPRGIKLWNLRRSGFNVKKYIVGHINTQANNGLNIRYENDNMAGYVSDRWVTVSPNYENGAGTFGRMAQRGVVVKELKALIDVNQSTRDTDTVVFNLIATPGYPEAIQNMIAFNTDRGQTAFVVGDTPFRLQPTGTALSAWGNNTGLAFDNGDVGGVSYDEYMAMFYPSGYTTDNTGNNIVVPPSHMMLRTIVNSDAKSYQWFAPAGTRRGGVDNATSVGYIDSLTSEFKTVALYEGLRTVLHDVKINPIATLPGVGIVNFGQYTRAKNTSSLDRINVARLVCYLRRQLSILAKPYLFEPNDAQTRREIKAAAESLMLELVGQRALYDFIVVCDESNNTPSRIDHSELYMDIAIEPVKAVEFIYIPLRLKNTGDIRAGL